MWTILCIYVLVLFLDAMLGFLMILFWKEIYSEHNEEEEPLLRMDVIDSP